jgi:3-deoxy-D-manno-octulosonate 8-phosphate phosphatase KdsC-like HAD superfamily phosphatase
MIKIVCLDVDGVICDFSILCNNIKKKKILENHRKLFNYLNEKSIPIAVVSARPCKIFFPLRLSELNFPGDTTFYFNKKGLFDSAYNIANRKVQQLKNICADHAVKPCQVLFVDDKTMNTNMAKNNGFATILCNKPVNLFSVIYNFINTGGEKQQLGNLSTKSHGMTLS